MLCFIFKRNFKRNSQRHTQREVKQMSRKYIPYVESNLVSTGSLDVSGSLALKGITVVSPQSGTAVKINLVAPGVIVAPSGGLTEATLVFPSQPLDGQIVFISFTQNVGKVIFTNGKFANASTLGPVVSAGDSIVLYYNGDTSKWYKLSGTSSSTAPSPSPSPAPSTPPPTPETPPPAADPTVIPVAPPTIPVEPPTIAVEPPTIPADTIVPV